MMTTILWIIAVVLVVAGVFALLRKEMLWGAVLIIVGLLVGPGGVSISADRSCCRGDHSPRQGQRPIGAQKFVAAQPGRRRESQEERIMGATSDKIQGQAKEVTGIVTGDEDLEAQGKSDRKVGQAEEKIDDAKDKVKDVLDDVKDKAADLADKAKDKLPGK